MWAHTHLAKTSRLSSSAGPVGGLPLPDADDDDDDDDDDAPDDFFTGTNLP